jgi:hypothetical protein
LWGDNTTLSPPVHYYNYWGDAMGRPVKRIKMLKSLYKAVVRGRREFTWRDFFVLLAPIASHTYIQNTLYDLMGRGVLVKHDHRYIVIADKLKEILRQYKAI